MERERGRSRCQLCDSEALTEAKDSPKKYPVKPQMYHNNKHGDSLWQNDSPPLQSPLLLPRLLCTPILPLQRAPPLTNRRGPSLLSRTKTEGDSAAATASATVVTTAASGAATRGTTLTGWALGCLRRSWAEVKMSRVMIREQFVRDE